MRHPLWGKEGNLDYWSALSRGEVPRPEQKAVALLERVCDEYRFSLYCVTGQLPVMGNVTKRVYLALKAGGLLELEDGDPVAWWCFSVGPYAPDIPDTDNVVVCRSMVEGEELAFLETGDRHSTGFHFTKHSPRRMVGVADPFVTKQLGRNSPKAEYDSKAGDFRARAKGPVLWPDMAIGTERTLDREDFEKGFIKWLDSYPGLVQDPIEAQQVALISFRVRTGRSSKPKAMDFEGVGQMGDYLQLGDDGGFQVGPDVVQGQFPEGGNFQYDQQAFDDIGLDARAELEQLRRDLMALEPPAQLVQRAPILPDGVGFDMHDGTVLHVDERACHKMLVDHGIRVEQEVQRLMDEGHPPDMVDYVIQTMLTQYLGPNPDLDAIPNPNQMDGYVGVREYAQDDPDIPHNAVVRPLPNGNVALL